MLIVARRHGRSGARSASAMPRIGFLTADSPGESAGVVPRFAKDYAKRVCRGQYLAIAFRWADAATTALRCLPLSSSTCR